MSTDQEAYDALSSDQQAAFDKAAREKEEAEQAALPYSWRQDLDSVTVDVVLPAGVKGRDLAVSLQRTKISAGLKGKDAIVAGELFAPIKVDDDSTWSLSEGVLSLELQKAETQRWWPHVLVGAPKRDTTKLTPENSKLSDLDGEMRGVVEKMMFDNRQKQQGLPTSDELKKQENIKRFIDAHPEMDFSNAKMT